ncbi:hypothetical protein GCK32_022297 [Trichostrongylus colubriformis]|uniref:Uncharacterized protein n=1 Tax=Trichostrongylus colubriformis TaxID=6319 RepID=A0AAN8IEA6_TRICO
MMTILVIEVLQVPLDLMRKRRIYLSEDWQQRCSARIH